MFQAFIQPCAKGSLKQPDHSRYDPAFLDKINLPLENRRRIVVKSHDKASLDLQTGSLYVFHVFNQVAVLILTFVAFGKASLIRRLNADKDLIKSCCDHQVH